MTEPPSTNRRLLVVSLSGLAALVALLVSYLLFGEQLVEDAWNGRSFRWLNRHYTGSQRPALRDAILAMHERVALVFLAVFVAYGLLVYAYLMRRLRRGRMLLTAGLVAAYACAELFLAPRLAEPLRLDHLRGVRDPDHLPRPAPGSRGWNSDALRQEREPHEYRQEDFNVIFLGDSFTLGRRLRRPTVDAFPARAERLLDAALPDVDVRVANFGWSSSSPLLSYRRLVDIGARYHPDLVVLCVDMTDPHDDIKWTNMIARRGVCNWYDRLPLAIKALRLYFPSAFGALYDWTTGADLPYHRYFHTEQPLDASRPFLEPIQENIRRIDAESRRLGARLVVFVYPRSFQVDARECPDDREMGAPRSRHTLLGPYSLEPFRFFAEWDRETDFPILSLLEDFRSASVFPLCFEDDPHWNESGHRVAAEGIARRLRPIVEQAIGERE